MIPISLNQIEQNKFHSNRVYKLEVVNNIMSKQRQVNQKSTSSLKSLTKNYKCKGIMIPMSVKPHRIE